MKTTIENRNIISSNLFLRGGKKKRKKEEDSARLKKKKKKKESTWFSSSGWFLSINLIYHNMVVSYFIGLCRSSRVKDSMPHTNRDSQHHFALVKGGWLLLRLYLSTFKKKRVFFFSFFLILPPYIFVSLSCLNFSRLVFFPLNWCPAFRPLLPVPTV